jgi:hypothetical protein
VTAAERAAEVIYAMLDDEHAVVACLMADPALLVDLAIAAGALVRLSDTFAWKPDPDWPGCAIVNTDGPNGRVGDNWQPLYRRTTQENQP